MEKGIKVYFCALFPHDPFLPQYLSRELKDLWNQINYLCHQFYIQIISEMQQSQESENPMLCMKLIL